MKRLKICCDEHVQRAIRRGLESEGFDVTSVQEMGRRGTGGPELLQMLERDERVLLTNDDDLLPIAEEYDHAGICIRKALVPV